MTRAQTNDYCFQNFEHVVFKNQKKKNHLKTSKITTPHPKKKAQTKRFYRRFPKINLHEKIKFYIFKKQKLYIDDVKTLKFLCEKNYD